MRCFLVFVAMSALAGCANLSHETVAEESMWQAENVIDFMQTTEISREPTHFYEDGTMSVFTGPHPSEGQVIAYSALFGAAHFAVTEVLNLETQGEYPWLERTWQFAGLCFKTNVIRTNHRHGLSFTGTF